MAAAATVTDRKSPNPQPATRNPQDIREIAARTIAHYERRAQEFHAGTKGHDVSQNIAALLGTSATTRFRASRAWTSICAWRLRD